MSVQPDSFSWYLQALKEKEQQQKQQQQQESTSAPLDEKQEIKLLRYIKVFKPTLDKLGDICVKEFNLPLSVIAEILDKLERDGQIEFVDDTVRLTPKGREKV